jgi:hypothetical protein
MEDLTRLVAESMARHGVDVPVDHRRLEWSRWFRCESSFDLLLTPSKPGIFALAEELLAPGEMPVVGGKRMLAIFEVNQAEDLDIAMVRRFAPGGPAAQRLAGARIFARYTVIEDAAQRHSAHAALRQWLAASAEAASGIVNESNDQFMPVAVSPAASQTTSDEGLEKQAVSVPTALPAGF